MVNASRIVLADAKLMQVERNISDKALDSNSIVADKRPQRNTT